VEWKGNKEDTLAIVVCVLLEAPKSGWIPPQNLYGGVFICFSLDGMNRLF
jgi:hypothetical protein